METPVDLYTYIIQKRLFPFNFVKSRFREIAKQVKGVYINLKFKYAAYPLDYFRSFLIFYDLSIVRIYSICTNLFQFIQIF